MKNYTEIESGVNNFILSLSMEGEDKGEGLNV